MLAETAAIIAAQIHDQNNNGTLSNNNRIGQKEDEGMVEMKKNNENEKEMANVGMTSNCSINVENEEQPPSLLTILDREISSNLMEDEAMIVEEEEEGIELELVENFSVEGESEMERKKGWERRVEAIDGLNRLRNLGSFLAEQLANEAEKQDRAWASARRQRHSLLDALIHALVEKGEGMLGGKKRNNGKLLGVEKEEENGWRNVPRKKSHSFDFGHKCQQEKVMVANGWPRMGTNIENRSNAQTKIHHLPLSSSSMNISNGGIIVRYNLLKESNESSILLENGPKNEEKKKREEEEEEENLDEVIYL